MELLLQFGYGMMSLTKELIESWEGGRVILSPRDLTLTQMINFTQEIAKNNGKVAIDPQFYVPQADHGRLISHSFWPQDYQTALFKRAEIQSMLRTLKTDYNDPLHSDFFILPGLMSTTVNEDWYKYNNMVVEEALSLIQDKEVFFTVCLSKEAMADEATIYQIIEYLDTWNLSGCYVVAQPPSNEYLVTDPNWLVNLMDLTAGIKQQNKKVIVGYSNHQMIQLALSKIDGLASGNWLNVRSFNTNRCNNPEEGPSRRSTWYYCPQALTEYQVSFLDIANRIGMLQELKTNEIFGSNYSDPIFNSGAQPTTVNYTLRHSFLHYLTCLKFQLENSVKATYPLTLESVNMQFETARMLTETFTNKGIRGRDRDFANVVDYNISSVAVFDNLRGLIQKNTWNSI